MYDIEKSTWHTCQLCKKSIQELARIYGGSNIYYYQVFKLHLINNHNISADEYFSQILTKPKCKCGICNKNSHIVKRNNTFGWRIYVCGRYEGQQEWSEKAKTARLGPGNPMYGKKPWNKGTKGHPAMLAGMKKKQTWYKTSNETRQKMSESAKKRLVHGHNMPHSEETKQKLRESTLRAIARGAFKQTQTTPMRYFAQYLKEQNIEFECEKIVSHWAFDFYLPLYDTYIEIDGDYFHSNPKFYPNGPTTKTQKINQSRDYAKNKYCQTNNIKLIRFWENDILNKKEDVICCLKKSLGLEN